MVRKRITDILILIFMIIFIPFIRNGFLIPRLFILSLIPLVFFKNKFKLSFPSIALFFLFVAYLFLNLTFSGVFIVIQLILFVLLFELYDPDRDTFSFIRTGIFIISVYAILQFIGLDLKIWEYDWIDKSVFSVIGNPNSLGILLMMGAVNEMVRKNKNIPFLTVNTLALLLTFSKGSIIIFLLIGIIFIFRRSKYTFLIYTATAFLLILFIFSWDSPKNTRRTLYNVNIKAIKNNILGTGTGSFPVSYKNTFIEHNMDQGIKNTKKLIVKRAHNEIMHFAIEMGPFGTFAILTLFIFLTFIIFKKNLIELYPVLGFLLAMLYDFPLRQPTSVFFAIILIKRHVCFKQITIPGFFKIFIFVPLLVNSLQLFGEFRGKYFFYDRAVMKFETAKKHYISDDHRIVKKSLDQGLREDVYPEMLNYQGLAEYALGDFEKAHEIWKRSKSLVPEHRETRIIILKHRNLEKNWVEIEVETKEYLEYFKDTQAYYTYAMALFHNGKYRQGIIVLRDNYIPGDNVAFINFLLGNYENARRYATESGKLDLYDTIYEIRINNIGCEKIPVQKINGIKERTGSYSLNDLLTPFPDLIKDSDENVFNPTYYLHNIIKNNFDLESVEKLRYIFPEFDHLKTAIYIDHLYGEPSKREIGCYLDQISFEDFSKEEKPLLDFYFKDTNDRILKNYYEYQKKNLPEDDINVLKKILNYDKIYENALEILGFDFFIYWYINRATAGLIYEGFTDSERELIVFCRDIAENWQSTVNNKKNIDFYNKYKDRKKMTLQEFYLYLFMHFYFDRGKIEFPKKNITDAHEYQLLYDSTMEIYDY